MVHFVILLILIGVIVLMMPLLLGILMTYKSLKQYVNYPISACPSDAIPEKVRPFFQEQEIALTSLGFEPAGFYIHEKGDVIPQVGFVEHCVHAGQNTSAKVYYLQGAHTIAGYIEFISVFSDNSIVITANSPESVYGAPEHIAILRIHEHSLDKLFALHVERINAGKDTASLISIKNFDYIKETERINRDILSYQEQLGLLKPCKDGNAYHPTFYGSMMIMCRVWTRYLARR